ncbi:nitrate/sulfonate/bicarbonate ABC transporter ATP-binding protein [Propionicicella superfundia]|uniref:ABC transporter ATP-binding protein n=1 Tax=Propionicicella superfundia TaxID=348582 RepID=UPI000408517D|nr:nitrate/sulfonate/bicarbonate ABC transporter ATP-binding protein [Propionicicella superfundia]
MTVLAPTRHAPLLEVDRISRSFPGADGSALTVLDDITVTIRDGEIVALLGKSGSGKSTLLRTIAGLIAPTSGEVRYRGAPLTGANPGASMVFQSFALLPWLTVQGNVELGLRAAGLPAEECRERALAAIDAIGLDGFETAYPRELSGGMRQRVGFARAFVTQPDLLLMDEPFSALDVLTSENLRGELTDLWGSPDFPTSSICIVTHNIEEAVLLADRVLVLGANPGRIKDEVTIGLSRPRDRHDPAFEALVDRLYAILTGREPRQESLPVPSAGPLNTPLPAAGVDGMAGLVELVHGAGDSVELPDLAESLLFEVDDLLPLVDAAGMLGLLATDGAAVRVTETGASWQRAGILDRKAAFATLAENRAPLVRTIVTALRATPGGVIREGFFRDLLRRGYSAADTEEQLDIAIDWGRYGELFHYDAVRGSLGLDDPDPGGHR